jgi:poly(A) polymerase
VNSLYYDITRDKTVDITGLGIPDMKAGLLRTPMDPDETFNDDPVRILRALRFANRFGWRIDEAVYAALLRQIPRLVIVSRERIRTELAKMLCGPAPVEMMQTLRQTGILPYMVPILTGTYEPLDNGDEAPEPPLWDQSMRALGALSADAPLPARLAALFVGIGKLRTRSVRKKTGLVRYPNFERIGADMTRRILRQMKYERAEYNAAAALVAAQHDGLIYPELLDSMTAEQLDPKGAATAKTRRRRHRGGRRRRKSPAKKQ